MMFTSRLSLFLMLVFAATSASFQTDCEEAITKCEEILQEELAEAEDDGDRCLSGEFFSDCLDNHGCYDFDSDYPAQLADQKVEELCPSCEQRHENCRRIWETLAADALDDTDRCVAVFRWEFCIDYINEDYCEQKVPDEIGDLEDQYCKGLGVWK